MDKKVSPKKIEGILDKYNRDTSLLISILQDIQEEYNYLPADALRLVASELDIPLTQVYAMATFFKAFTLTPRGDHLIHVCSGTACHVRGTNRILDSIERTLKIKSGETTTDGKFTLETVNCLGACALGPVVVVDGKYHGEMNPSKTEELLGKTK